MIQELYLKELTKRIEESKFYPKAARRRHIEGVVSVSFTLLEGGRIEGLQVKGGHKLLRKSTEDAVQKAKESFPPPPKGLLLPLPVQFSVEFKLR